MTKPIHATLFEQIVQQFLSPEEYHQQQHLLTVVLPEHRFAFVSCLAHGIAFRDCFGLLENYLRTKKRVEEAYRRDNKAVNPHYDFTDSYTYTLDEFFVNLPTHEFIQANTSPDIW
jgi:hypothetical protein